MLQIIPARIVRTALVSAVLVVVAAGCARPEVQSSSYLFVWAGDGAGKGSDFLGVIDASADASGYGTIVASLQSGRRARILTTRNRRCRGTRTCWPTTLVPASPDISDPERPREVSTLTFGDDENPHWISIDATGRRIVVNSGGSKPNRLYIVNLDPVTGALSMDQRSATPGAQSPASH